MANPLPPSPKTLLRRSVRSRVDLIAPDDRARASARIASHLATWLAQFQANSILACYNALPREPSLATLPALLPQWTFAFPVTAANGHMEFHAVANFHDDLQPGPFGLLEPIPHRCPLADPATLAAIFCPGEAFTPDGHRLGKGGGFYDRFLPRCPPSLPRIGVAFATQIVPTIPIDSHDHHVDWIATENGITSTRSGDIPAT